MCLAADNGTGWFSSYSVFIVMSVLLCIKISLTSSPFLMTDIKQQFKTLKLAAGENKTARIVGELEPQAPQ